MASLQHEALVLLFRNRPDLGVELLRDALHTSLPAFTSVRVAEADLTEITPTEYRADLVLILEKEQEPVTQKEGAPQDKRRKRKEPPAGALIVEVQLHEDHEKRWSWPAYLIGLRSRLRCDTQLLVVTVEPAMAAWAARPIPLGHPGLVLTPLVLGPSEVPIVADEAEALRAPELAVLSAMAHKNNEAVAPTIGRAALRAFRQLDEERAGLYADLVYYAFQGAAKTALEALMASGNYEYQSDFAKKYFAEGKAQGEARGQAEAILAIFEARGIAVPDEARTRILACTDRTALSAWLKQALSAASVNELFSS